MADAHHHLLVERNPPAHQTSFAPCRVQHKFEHPEIAAGGTGGNLHEAGQHELLKRRYMRQEKNGNRLMKQHSQPPTATCGLHTSFAQLQQHLICHRASQPASQDPSLCLFGEGVGVIWKNLQKMRKNISRGMQSRISMKSWYLEVSQWSPISGSLTRPRVRTIPSTPYIVSTVMPSLGQVLLPNLDVFSLCRS